MLEAQEGDRFGRRDEGLGAIVVAGLERWHDPTRGGEWRTVEPNLAGEEVTRRGAASYEHPLVSWQLRSDESRGEGDCHRGGRVAQVGEAHLQAARGRMVLQRARVHGACKLCRRAGCRL